ncbi:MAG: hypothetical protein LQ348_002816 [Seirophora lacunosa]|nr:MAG: hypothetical protein LQ344_001657 [Seirophora lacunosa]KAI4193636.1 MAG: hypothetical protein LQ348_002816 [Seirophora lacunosa]
MPANKKRKKTRLLSHTRPTLSGRKKPSLSSQATRSLIGKHHNLQKQIHNAISNGDNVAADALRAELAASGGLQRYQDASIQGQSAERGGDTSKVLVEWMDEMLLGKMHGNAMGNQKLRMLEVGALKVDNACSRSGIFDVARIDLHSQHPGIQTQDFMERPLPSQSMLEEGGFDIVSLSLVVNYVGDAARRGEMLKRVGGFLRVKQLAHTGDDLNSSLLPALFLVLPAPCVTNSRYLDEETLEAIMTALGYVQKMKKFSKKLVYYVWSLASVHGGEARDVVFKKKEVRPGGQRNNFAIILQ